MPEITDFINTTLLMQILRITIISMFLINLLLLVFTILHKTYVERREEKIKGLKDTYIQLISQYYTVPQSELAKLKHGIQFQALCDVLIEILESVYGEMEYQLTKLAEQAGIVNYYRKKAMSRFWLRRCYAVEKLGFLKLAHSKSALYEILKREKNPHVIHRIIWALSHIADENDINTINRLLLNLPFGSSKFNEYIYTNIIRFFRQRGEEEKFVEYLKNIKDDKSLPVLFKRDIIEACGSENFYQAKDVIIDYFRYFDEVDELKITCVRALGKMGGEDVCRIIQSCLVSEDWRVRAVAAKNSYLCSDEIVDTLKRCLYDYNYYVRMNAAVSLSRLGERGRSAIMEGCSSYDRFARDACSYILKEVECRA